MQIETLSGTLQRKKFMLGFDSWVIIEYSFKALYPENDNKELINFIVSAEAVNYKAPELDETSDVVYIPGLVSDCLLSFDTSTFYCYIPDVIKKEITDTLISIQNTYTSLINSMFKINIKNVNGESF